MGELADKPDTVSVKVSGAINAYLGKAKVAAVAVAALTADFLLEPKFTTSLAAVVLKFYPVMVMLTEGLNALGVNEVI